MPAAKTRASETITIPTLKFERITVALRGRTGLYINRMPAKAKRDLLIGSQKKTQAERKEIKHKPREEYQDCMHIDEAWHEYSNVRFPAMAIKSAMGTAALMTPGIKKTDVSRLVFIPDENVPIFGIPKLRMTVMRSADINRTPDVRTRPWFEHWGTIITIQYSTPSLSKNSILALLSNAGIVCGVGDERQDKGKGSAGTFEVADSAKATDKGPGKIDLVKVFGEDMLNRDGQFEAIQSPVAADSETEFLLRQFDDEVAHRASA